MARSIEARELLAAAEAADLAAEAGNSQQERRAVMELFKHREVIQMALINAQMAALSQTPHVHERLPLREDGDDVGRVESRIPKGLFFHLLQQKNFGWEGLTSDEGQRDLKKAWPMCAVKTVSGKTTVGWTAGNRQSPISNRQGRVHFGFGTIALAN